MTISKQWTKTIPFSTDPFRQDADTEEKKAFQKSQASEIVEQLARRIDGYSAQAKGVIIDALAQRLGVERQHNAFIAGNGRPEPEEGE